MVAKVWVTGKPLRIQDGVFCFGLAPELEKPLSLHERYDDGREEMRELTPKVRDFPLQRIDGLPEDYVNPSKEEQQRIRRDDRAIVKARSEDTDEIWFAEKFNWSANGPITSVFGSRRVLNGEPREPRYDVDIAAHENSPVRAPAPGVATLAEELFLSGNTVIINHGHGVTTSYLHMNTGRECGRHAQAGTEDWPCRQDGSRYRSAPLLANELVSNAVGCGACGAIPACRQSPFAQYRVLDPAFVNP